MIDAATGRLRLMAYQAKPPEAAAAINSIMATAAGDAGLEALHGTTVYNDLERDGSSFAMRHELLAQGIRGLAIFPLIVSGEPAGCLILMTEESGLFDAAEMHLLVELAGDISFALDHIDKSEKLNYLAYYDSLTGLANRTLFAERLAIHAAAAARGNGRFALVLAAPERSEGFNDALGRTAGDELTRELAARFVRTVGDTHRIGRIGSDRFAAIILDPESDYAVESALEKWWREWPGRPFEVEGREVSISAKAGISLFPADGTDAETLLRHAQAALNKAKNSPARHVFYTANLGARLAERLTLENEIRRAIEYEELALHYHPKVEMRERRLVGVEALMRWRSPRLGVVTPRDFIPIMEETGLIVEAGAWALRQACIDRSRWLERRLAAPRIAVNVSAIQLRHDGFVRTFTDVLRRAGAEPGIDVEVTESLLLEDVEENIKKLSQIRELGVHIALDDFGTGYSSLSYLAKLPVATLKIDRSFVLGMVDDPGATALVSTIISLARSLKLETVAEGVESEEQAKILRLLQCDQMQGYLISQPLPWDEMAVYLDGNGR
jgi:diguanylate cyclase (GGDEF)-like protein